MKRGVGSVTALIATAVYRAPRRGLRTRRRRTMDRQLAVIVQILALSAPLLCRRLPDGDHKPTADRIVTAEHNTDHGPTAATANDRTELQFTVPSAEEHATPAEPAPAEPAPHESAQRYGFIPTPNIATPILNALVLPTTYPAESPYSAPHPRVPIIRDHEDYDWPRRKHHRKIKANDDTLWTKFPNMKHLVEIVPIKHNSNTKGKALAYIVPQSHTIKNTLKKQKRISGIVLDKNIPDFSQVLQNSEKNSFFDSSESKSSSESDSIESNSSDYEDKPANDHTKIGRTPEKTVTKENDNSNSEVTINDKLNNIASYVKEHNDVDINSLVHDVLPVDEVDPAYQVHYIIHKKHRPNNNHNSTKNNTYHHQNNIIHINYEPNENDVNTKEIHVHPQSDNLKFIDGYENHHNQVKINDNIEHPNEKSNHSSHTIHEHVVEPYHNTLHSNRELKHDVTEPTHHSDTVVQHTHSSEDLGYITIGDHDEGVLIESIEQLHDLIHKGEVEPELKDYEISTEIKSPSHEIQVSHEEKQIHHIHVYTDSNTDDSDQSNDSINHSDDLSSVNYSDSLNDEAVIEESSQSADSSDSNAKDSVDSSYESQAASDSEHDSHEDISYSGDIIESNQNDSHDPISADDPTPEQYLQEHDIIDATSQESAPRDSIEPNVSLHDNGAELSLEHLSGHDFVFPNCKKLKKNKSVRKCDADCDGHKSYTLKFLFNR